MNIERVYHCLLGVKNSLYAIGGFNLHGILNKW